MWISKYVCLFMIYSIFGWIFESIFCTVKGGKWENRGFLYGPFCPIYGIGALAVAAVTLIFDFYGFSLNIISIFVISVIGSAVLEYVTSFLLEKIFHALWWDYSRLPFNIKGRISLFTSLGFGIGGVVIAYWLLPFTDVLMSRMSPLVTEFTSLCFIFLFTVDLTLTVTALLHFDRIVIRIENDFNRNMESLVDDTLRRSVKIKNEIDEKKNIIMNHADSFNGLMKSSILRVNSFRGEKALKDTVRSQLFSAIKKAGKKNQ